MPVLGRLLRGVTISPVAALETWPRQDTALRYGEVEEHAIVSHLALCRRVCSCMLRGVHATSSKSRTLGWDLFSGALGSSGRALGHDRGFSAETSRLDLSQLLVTMAACALTLRSSCAYTSRGGSFFTTTIFPRPASQGKA
jgi:hypothetical protein